jgi:hypothetical protein
MPRATPKVRWWAVLRPFRVYSSEVLRLGPFHGAAVRMGRSRLAEVVSRIFRTFGLAERHPALAHAVMAPLIC